MKKIIIHDIEIDKYMGYLKMIPAVCAQGDTREEVIEKLKKGIKSYVKYKKGQ